MLRNPGLDGPPHDRDYVRHPYWTPGDGAVREPPVRALARYSASREVPPACAAPAGVRRSRRASSACRAGGLAAMSLQTAVGALVVSGWGWEAAARRYDGCGSAVGGVGVGVGARFGCGCLQAALRLSRRRLVASDEQGRPEHGGVEADGRERPERARDQGRAGVHGAGGGRGFLAADRFVFLRPTGYW